MKPSKPTSFEYVLASLLVAKKKDKFLFTVEASGVLPPAAIVKKSIQILRNKLKNLEEKIV